MSGRRHLFLALGPLGWGEATMGIRVARQLHEAGDEASFVVHERSLPLLTDTPFRRVPIHDHLGPLIKLLVESQVAEEKPDSIILADYFTATVLFLGLGVDPRFLLRFDTPLIAIDTWNHSEAGFAIDGYGDRTREVANWIDELPYRLRPAPIVRPLPRPGVCSILPDPVRLARRVRNHVRSNIGLTPSERAVMFCTAQWQYAANNDEEARILAENVPELLAFYVSKLGDDVHLVHVGPAAYPLSGLLGERYHWLPALSPDQFDMVLGSMDLLLSANISATTNAKAVASSIPVVVVENSCLAATVEEAEAALPGPPSPFLRQWIGRSLPLYPFRLWPLGFYDFLQPVLQDNSYCSAMEVVELLDEDRVVATCNALLDSGVAREDLLQRQAAYAAETGRLLTPVEIIESFFSGDAECRSSA
jgi:hypothetical protein